jgi:hypothetical protein
MADEFPDRESQLMRELADVKFQLENTSAQLETTSARLDALEYRGAQSGGQQSTARNIDSEYSQSYQSSRSSRSSQSSASRIAPNENGRLDKERVSTRASVRSVPKPEPNQPLRGDNRQDGYERASKRDGGRSIVKNQPNKPAAEDNGKLGKETPSKRVNDHSAGGHHSANGASRSHRIPSEASKSRSKGSRDRGDSQAPTTVSERSERGQGREKAQSWVNKQNQQGQQPESTGAFRSAAHSSAQAGRNAQYQNVPRTHERQFYLYRETQQAFAPRGSTRGLDDSKSLSTESTITRGSELRGLNYYR